MRKKLKNLAKRMTPRPRDYIFTGVAALAITTLTVLLATAAYLTESRVKDSDSYLQEHCRNYKDDTKSADYIEKVINTCLNLMNKDTVDELERMVKQFESLK